MDVISGLALGGFLGLLVGFSTSPVAAVVVGALSAGMLALLGIQAKVETTTSADALRAQSHRIFGFGLAATATLLGGVYLRAQDAFTRRPAELASEWRAAGIPAPGAAQIVAYMRTGILLGDVKVSDRMTPPSPQATSTALFAAPPELCGRLEPRRFQKNAETIHAWTLAPSPWKDAAIRIAKAPDGQQQELLTAIWTINCAGGSE